MIERENKADYGCQCTNTALYNKEKQIKGTNQRHNAVYRCSSTVSTVVRCSLLYSSFAGLVVPQYNQVQSDVVPLQSACSSPLQSDAVCCIILYSASAPMQFSSFQSPCRLQFLTTQYLNSLLWSGEVPKLFSFPFFLYYVLIFYHSNFRNIVKTIKNEKQR